ncbi:MAG: metallopeptidase family protein [Nitrospiraceae bacterium]
MSPRKRALTISESEFQDLVRQALDGLPEEYAELIVDVAVDMEEEPTPEVLADLDMDENDDLLGLYQGNPSTRTPSSVPPATCQPEFPFIADRFSGCVEPGEKWCRKCATPSCMRSDIISDSPTICPTSGREKDWLRRFRGSHRRDFETLF